MDAEHRVIITGSAAEATLAAHVADGRARDLSGRLDLPQLAAVLERAQVVVAPNTGPAHLAAAVATPVVSLFAPVVPAARWAPYGIPMIILGDQEAACRDSRARICPLPGHPCLSSIRPEEVVDAVGQARLHRSWCTMISNETTPSRHHLVTEHFAALARAAKGARC